jgi:hypothetical protein
LQNFNPVLDLISEDGQTNVYAVGREVPHQRRVMLLSAGGRTVVVLGVWGEDRVAVMPRMCTPRD